MKKIFYLLLISIGLTSFVNATEIRAYNISGTLWVEVKDKPNNYKDWIGIFPKNASNTGSNVIAWKWARKGNASPDKPNTDEYLFFHVPYGEYDVRFFLNNTYKTEYQTSISFHDPYRPAIEITSTPTPHENIHFKLKGILSGDRDWIGIYPKNASNSWSNVVTWKWAKKRDITLAGVPAGDYEARLFFNNSYKLEAKVKFSVSPQSEGYTYPEDVVFKYRPTDNSVANPNRGSSVIDPQFGTTITRLTDANIVDENGNSCVDYTYPKIQSWNADMSLLRVKFKLYDADTLKESPITKGLNCNNSYNKLGYPDAFRWSHTDAKVFYSIKSNHSIQGNFIFMKNTIQKNNTIKHEIVKDFSNEHFDIFMMSEGEGNMSYDDKLVIFKVKKQGVNYVSTVLLNTETKKWTIKDWPDTSAGHIYVKGDLRVLYDWVSISPKGNYILENKVINAKQYRDGQHLDYEPEKAIFRYDLDFKNRKKLTTISGHGDMGIDSNGDQVWVQFEYGNRAGTWSYNIDTLEDILVGKKLLQNTAGHISCQNYKRPGWCYLSTYYEKEVYALKLDGSGIVNRFVQSRNRNIAAYAGVSPDGKRVVFRSNWDTGGKPDIYHAGLKTNMAAPNTKTLYEDAEDGNTNGWNVYDGTPAGATISNVFDADKGSQVIKLQGSSTQNGYKLGGNWKNSERKSIQWKMKYDERYVVYISVNTSKGHRYIYYTATDNDRGYDGGYYIHHGLGSFTTDATWHVFTRDLAADLKDYEKDNNLLSINGFLIRGSGLVDDIQLLQ